MHRTHSRAALVWLATALLVAPAAHAADVTVTLESGSDFVVRQAGGPQIVSVDGDTANILRGGALFVHTTGIDSLFVGREAGHPANLGSYNSGFGRSALVSNISGTRNSAFGAGALMLNSTGNSNTAAGWNALTANTSGYLNSAFGASALRYGGSANSAFGAQALYQTTAGENAAFGAGALFSNTTGTQNVALGLTALGQNTTGSRNVAVGHLAGLFQTTGSDNIYLAHRGLAGESGQIKIGTVGTHTQAHIAGIHGSTTSGVAVLVDPSGALGTLTSSARFKQDVRDMGGDSDRLMRLRPVSFRYREDAVGAEGAKTTQYGLIAEEVAQVAPELVALDLEGQPYSVKYHELPALLLNELQQQERTIESQRAVIAELAARVERLEAR